MIKRNLKKKKKTEKKRKKKKQRIGKIAKGKKLEQKCINLLKKNKRPHPLAITRKKDQLLKAKGQQSSKIWPKTIIKF